VIMPLVKSYRHMLIKNIIYTGITRAKESLILCGDQNAFYDALRNEGITRNTTMSQSLHDKFNIAAQKKKDSPQQRAAAFDEVPERDRTPEYLAEVNLFRIPAMMKVEKPPYDFI